MSKFFLIADINKQVITVNLDQVAWIGDPIKDEDTGIVTNRLTMANGDSWNVPVQLLIGMLNASEVQVFDLISPPKDMTETNDVNDTEYVDDTPLEEPRGGEVELQNYPGDVTDGHEEYTSELTAGEDFEYNPADHINDTTVTEGSVGIADATISATGTDG